MTCFLQKKVGKTSNWKKIQEIPLSELHPFKDHPFKVKDDDAMIETADSIKKVWCVGSCDCQTTA